MVRRVSDFSIETLNVTDSTRNYLKKMPLSKVVSIGRRTAHYLERHHEAIKNLPNWKKELASELEKHGFIRHDFTNKTRCIINFYRSVYRGAIRDYDESIYNDDNVFGSFYDNATNISNDKICELMEVINHLKEDERNIIILYYGIMDGKPKGIEEISKILCMTETHADHYRRRALGKICRNCEMLPSIIV